MERVPSTIRSLAAILASLAATQAVVGDGPFRPFPQHTTYAPGTIRPSNHSQAQLDADVRAAYDWWKSHYVVAAGTTPQGYPKYRVTFGTSNPGRTVSEGQGYGMITVAMMAGHDAAAQTVFDGLWRFTRANPSNIDSRLMAWEVPQDSGGESSAFDGDCDMAYGLLLADAQWGSSSSAPGAINYRAEFETLAAGLLASTIGPLSRYPMLGDWVNANGSTHNQWTPRSSDIMTGHFRAFARALAQSNPSASAAWAQVVAKTQGVVTSLQANYSPGTGLLPDFIVRTSASDNTPMPAPAGFLEGTHDGHYYYNAFRDPLRLGADALLNNDATAMAQTRKLADWVAQSTGGSVNNLRAGYLLNGTPVSGSNYFTTVVAAPFAVGAMTRPSQQSWLNALYDSVRNHHENYYEDSVAMLCMLVLSGNWWDPTLAGACEQDLNDDGVVDGADLGVLLGQWGPAPGGSSDFNGDGMVDGADLGVLLGAWGTCA
jgi:hypothetical protein